MTRTNFISLDGKIITPVTMKNLQTDNTLNIVCVGIGCIANHWKYIIKNIINGTEIKVYLPFIMEMKRS